jgi:GNAT superfamily N-acetyltransferase
MTSATPELVQSCETAEQAAVTSWHEAMPESLRRTLRVGGGPLGSGFLVHAAADVLMFNRVVGLGVGSPASEADLDQAVAHFEAAGARRFMVQVAPHARPGTLLDWLAARGFYRHNHWIRLVRDTSAVESVRTELRVSEFGEAHADEFGRMEAEAFGHPPELAGLSACLVGQPGWRFFGAFDGDALVSVSALRVNGPAAWFGFASTHATHRGRGAQSALIAARIEAAREAGCRWVCVETAPDTPEKPNPSTHNLRRLGFTDAYERPNWVKVLHDV